MFRKLIKSVLIVFIIGFILYSSTCYYIESNKQEVLKVLEDSFADYHNGTVHFDDITLSSWMSFPSVIINIKGVKFVNNKIEKHKQETIIAEEAQLKISIAHLYQRKIQVKSVDIKNATVTLITNVNPDSTATKDKKKDSKKKALPLEKDTEITIENLNLAIINHQKKKSYKFKVNKLATTLTIDEDEITGTADLDVIVEDLTFNHKGGSFFNGAQVKGTIKPFIDFKNKKITLPLFDLDIDQQRFAVSGEILTDGPGTFIFNLENQHTLYKPSIGLLTEKIQQKLVPYDIEKPIYSQVSLEGSFAPKSNPLVKIKFNTENNTATIRDSIHFENVSLEGNFINRLYDDERALTESPKDIRLLFSELTATYKGVDFKVENSSLASSPEIKTDVDLKLTAQGNTEQLNTLLNSSTFLFKNGTFDINATLDGDASNIDDLFAHSEITMRIDNSNVVNSKGHLELPLEHLAIDIDKNDAFLKQLLIDLPSGDKINLYGEIDNIFSLIKADASKPVYTDLHLQSKKLIWEDFLDLFNTVKGNKKRSPKHTLQETLKDVYTKFHPQLSVDIQELYYKNIGFKNFTSEVKYSSKNNLHLENTSFNFNAGKAMIDAALDLTQEQQIQISSAVQLEGKTTILNDLFKTEKFIFEGGDFDLQANVEGDIKHIDNLIATANSSLHLSNMNVILPSENVSIPIDTLDVDITDNNAILNTLAITLESGDQMDFSGELDNIKALLLKDSDKKVRSELNIHSKKLRWDDFLVLFHPKKQRVTKEHAKNNLRKVLSNIYTSFDPHITLSIDDFIYDEELNIQSFTSGVHFNTSSQIALEQTKFIYDSDAQVLLSGTVDVPEGVTNGTYIDARLNVNGLPDQLNEILENDTFFLKGGSLNLEAHIKGDIKHIDSLIKTSSSVLKVSNSSVTYNNIDIPVNELEVDITEDNAILKNLEIELHSGDKISFSGKVDHITSLVLPKLDTISKVSSDLHIYSKKLVFEDVTSFFSIFQKKKKTPSKNGLKDILEEVYFRFDPQFDIAIDQFKYDNITVQNFKSGFHFENEHKLYLENTDFDYYDGSIHLNAHLDIVDPEETLFAVAFKTNQLDFEKVLNEFDFFNIDVLKKAEKIGGQITLDATLEGDYNNAKGLKKNTLKGQVGFTIGNTELKGFTPITEITDKVFKKNRFKDIKFAPIENTIYISNNTVEIPQLEIQSNSFNLFAEGHLGFEDVDTNMWISVPLENLRKRDLVNIPDKKGYIDAGKKVFIEIKNDDEKKLAYKLHLTNKKLYKEKNMLSQYREHHRREGLLRRKHRRQARSKKQ